MRFPSLGQIAYAAWNTVAVANRTVEVNTKTGFSLTAGSYSVRASSTQGGIVTLASTTSGTATISSVTTTRAFLSWLGNKSNAETVGDNIAQMVLTNATTITVTKLDGNNAAMSFNVLELF